MQNKHLQRLVAALFWLMVWGVAARLMDVSFAIPTPWATLQAWGGLVTTGAFYGTVAQSLGRILLGLLLGIGAGAVLAWGSVASPWVDAILRPAQRVIRCTPVASFIMVLWICVGRDQVPMAVALLMVEPVIWQSLTDGYQTLDPELDDVVRSFHATPFQRLTMFVLPSLKAVFLSAVVTAAGLAWKSGIAAEMIAYTASSIGREIADSRNLFDGPQMMAWTLTVIALSVGMEEGIKRLVKRWSR